MTSPARAERLALCDLLLEVGPDAPTLCAGWTTRDLAAHLVVRETRPDAAAGILIRRFAPHGDRVRDAVARREWTTLVDQIRLGPPRLSPMRLPVLDALTNTLEYFVHHEDVRRAGARPGARVIDAALEDALLQTLTRGARLMGRAAPCGLTMTPNGGISFAVRQGTPVVDVSGPVAELVLFIQGRGAAADVTFTGPASSVDAVRATSFGI